MKKLIPPNTGGGVKPSPTPSAYLSEAGALVLNIAAEKLIGGAKWSVEYEDDPAEKPAFVLRAASATDASAYKVIRSGGSSAKVTIRSLWAALGQERADEFIGRYSVRRVSGGLRLEWMQSK